MQSPPQTTGRGTLASGLLASCLAFLAVGLHPVWGQQALRGVSAEADPVQARFFEPREGLLLLKNMHLLEGHISKVGEHFQVAIGDSGQVQIPVRNVEAICETRDDAFLHLRNRLLSNRSDRRGKTNLHLHLAEWCLRHELLGRAAEEILAVAQLKSDHPALPTLERRVQTAMRRHREAATEETPRAATVAERADSATRPTGSSAAETATRNAAGRPQILLDDIPPAAIGRYTTLIQPMLLNKCATNRCHGSGSPSEFKLIYPTWTEIIPQRFTQRNLSSVLAQLHPLRPESSPLLIRPLKPHGGESLPVFGANEQQQFALLANWVDQVASPAYRRLTDSPRNEERSTRGASNVPPDPEVRRAGFESEAVPPNGSSGREAPDSRQAASESASNGQNARASRSRPNDRFDRSTFDEPGQPSFQPRDPFDPGIFNRRYFPSPDDQ